MNAAAAPFVLAVPLSDSRATGLLADLGRPTPNSFSDATNRSQFFFRAKREQRRRGDGKRANSIIFGKEKRSPSSPWRRKRWKLPRENVRPSIAGAQNRFVCCPGGRIVRRKPQFKEEEEEEEVGGFPNK